MVMRAFKLTACGILEIIIDIGKGIYFSHFPMITVRTDDGS